MAGEQNMRASDADRQRVAEALRKHAADGRLTLDELSERLEETYSARTIGQLEGSGSPMRELPALMPPLSAPKAWAAPLPPPYPGATRTGRAAAVHPAWTQGPRTWAVAVALFFLAAVAFHSAAGVVVACWVLFLVGLRFFRGNPWSTRSRGRGPHSHHQHW